MNPQVQQAIDHINQFIVENHNNEITADVLNPILVEIANLWGELVGDLSDSSVDGDTIIEMINQLQQNIEDVTGLTVHTGQPDPNVIPPTTYSAPDLYVRLTPSNIPYEVYIYNGIRWVLIDSGITKISEQWASYVLTGIGGLPILPQINENNRNINITGNPTGLSSLGGFVASGGTSIANFWDGMTAKVLNSSPNNQTIKHNYSGADIKYLFPNEEDYSIRPNEVVYFDLKGGNLVFRYSTFLNAKNVFFNNTESGLDATNAQDAIDEIVDKISVLDEVKNINLFIQYTESSVLGDSGTNLIQPDLGLPILEVDDLQTDSSYSGELVLNIENNSIATAKAIELFGAEVYNNTNPSADITTKISFTLDFFNQVGDDIDYKLSWEYLSSGEILFGVHTGTIDNTSDLDFELLVTGHSTDNFNLKKAILWRN